MTTKPVSVGSLKKGSTVVIEGVACKVTDTQVSRPGKHGHAKVRLTAIGLIDEKKRVIVMPGHDSIDTPIIDKKTAQVLSIKGGTANIMDMNTYETFDIKIPSELKGRCISGCNILYWQILSDRVMKEVKD